MILKTSQYLIQDEKSRNFDSPKDYPTLDDLMREQNVRGDKKNTVHRRRDLDSLG